MIDSQQASEALSDIDQIVARPAVADLRSRQPDHDPVGRAGFAGNIATCLWPREGCQIWIAVDVVGSLARWRSARSVIPAPACVRSMSGCWWRICCFCVRLFLLDVLVISRRARGNVLADLFMLFYSIAGLWFGYAFVAIGLGITALTWSAISTSARRFRCGWPSSMAAA